jgi:predicted ATPase/DNA-binding XRE family transcriptional regulator
MATEPEATPARFGNLLRQHRLAVGLTQEALAEKAGMSKRGISDLERGARSHPQRETIRSLVDALSLSGLKRAAFIASARKPRHPRRAATATVDDPFVDARPPTPLDALIGREHEVAEIAALLRRDDARLVTLTGPGGVGKTRVALAAAAAIRRDFTHGAAFVDLAPIRDPELVLPTVADRLGVRELGGHRLDERLRDHLAARRCLLLLDNLEHVAEAAPSLVELLSGTPGLTILATSRVPLRVSGEHIYRVLPLSLPERVAAVSWESLGESASVRLFMARAEAADAGLTLGERNAASVAEICIRLDGLPLAIELAAARAALLPPEALLLRLEPRLPMLTVGRRDAPTRQRTMTAAIGWSYDLLTKDEQLLLRALAVFADGWTLEAAEYCGNVLELPHPLDTLATLVEHHLVVRDKVDGAPRYRMLETIHAFARDRLLALDEEDGVRQAQLQHFIQVAQTNDLERLDAEVNARLAALIAESVNLRDVLTWALTRDPDAALSLLAELDYYWFLSDQYVAGGAYLGQALQAASQEDSWARGRVLSNAASLAGMVGDYPAATAYADAALGLADRLGDVRTSAHSLIAQAIVAAAHGDRATTRRLHEAALAQCAAIGDSWGMMLCVTDAGIAEQHWGNLPAAEAQFQRVRDMAQRLDLPESYHAHALNNLAEAYRQQGDLERAMTATRTAVDLSQGTVSRMMPVGSQFTLAKLLVDQGQHTQAAPLIAAFITYVWEMGDRWSLTQGLEAAGLVLRLAKHWEQAASLCGATEALRIGLPYPLGVPEREQVQQHIVALQSSLGPELFEETRQAGQTQSLDSIVQMTITALTLVPQELSS